MADATITIGGDINDLKRRLKEAGSEIKSFGDRAKSAVGSIAIGNFAADGARDLLAAMRRLAGATIDSVVSLDSLKRGLAAVEGSSKATEDRLESLREVAAMPGLGFEQSIQGFVGLRSVGLDAGLAEGALIEMGNALALVGKGKADLDGVVLALTQIVSKGKVSAEEINQIAERVPQVRAVMKNVFGTADTEALQKMNISAEEFIRRLVDGFSNEVPRASKSLQSSLDNMSDSWTAIGAKIGGAIVPELISSLEEFSKMAEFYVGTGVDMIQAYGNELETLNFWYAVLKESVQQIMPTQQQIDSFTVIRDRVNDMVRSLDEYRQAQALVDLLEVTEDPTASMEKKQAALIKYQERIQALQKRSQGLPEEQKKEGSKIDQDITKAKEDALKIAREMERVDRIRAQLGEREFQRMLEQLPPMLQVEAIEKRIAEEKERQSKIMDPQGEEEILEDRKRLMDLEDQLAAAVKRRGEAQAEAAREAAKAAEEAADKTRALLDVEKEMALLTAQALGDKKKVAAIEREMAIEQTKRAIMSQTGADETKARAMAERMQRLREMAASREEEAGRSKGTGGDEEDGQGKIRGYSFRERGSARDKLKGLLNDYYAMQQRGGMDRQNPAEVIAAKNAKEMNSGKDLSSRIDKLIDVTTRGLLGE